MKTASQRMAEKQGKESGGSWFRGAKVGDLDSVRTNDAIMATAPQAAGRTAGQAHQQGVSSQAYARSSPDSPGVDRPESRGSSVNFSYPARIRVASPTVAERPPIFEEAPVRSTTPEHQPKTRKRSSTLSPQRGGSVRYARPASVASSQPLVYDPNSRRMVPQTNVLALESEIQAAAEKKPKKKKSSLNRAGSHLSKGTVARSQGTAVDNAGPSEAQVAAAASLRSHRADDQAPDYDEPRQTQAHAAPEPEPEPQWQEPQPRHVQISQSPIPDAPKATSAPVPQEAHGGVLQRMPSVVREEEQEPGLDTEPEALGSTSAAPDEIDDMPVRQNAHVHGLPAPHRRDDTGEQNVELAAPAPLTLATTAASEPTPQQGRAAASGPLEVQEPQRNARAQSKSPVRNAHFGALQEAPTIKHEPPARSLSPRKSALKQSSPSRGASPRGDRSESDGVDASTRDPPVQRKKSVRVSFDDESTVVVGQAAGIGETDSPVPPSPQQAAAVGKRSWYSNLGIGRKKDIVPLEEDEVMKPRPALPSFGSVRERKSSPMPPEERPLVRPAQSGQESEQKTTGPTAAGHSSDHAVGAILHEQGSKNGANISKVREPLPPVVTSIEGNGYISDSMESSDDDAALLADTPRLETEDSRVSQASTLVPENFKDHDIRATTAGTTTREPHDVHVKDFGAAPMDNTGMVPAIAITQPSPRPEQSGADRVSYIHFPGEFPETETETDGEYQPARQATFEPIIQQADAVSTPTTPGTVLATQPALPETTDESEGDSIYSDAYEDLSEVDGDGFQSLDAVVDTPVPKTPPRNVLEKAEAQRAEASTPTPQPRDAEAIGSSDPDPWSAAKAYWRSLTAEKRAELEKEAAEEAGMEADLEDAQKEAKKPRRKKSVEQRNVEKRAIEEHRAAVDPARAYMIKPGTKAGRIDYEPTQDREIRQPQPNGAKPSGGMRLRKTMRADAAQPQPVDHGTHMRKSMRTEAPAKQAPQQRPISEQTLGNTTEVSGGKHSRRLSDTIQPSLRRCGSDSSASSFKRARPASSGLGFRKSMRSGSGSLDSQESQPTRFSLRGMSPNGRVASPPVSMGTRMRTSLRGDPHARRGSEDSGKGYLRFSGSFGRTSDKKGKRQSRFGDDSSDDEEPTPRRFTSRFDDSSDEETLPAASLSPSSLTTKTMRAPKGNDMPSPPLPEEEEMSDYGDNARGDETKTEDIATGTAADTGLRRSRSGRALDNGRPSSRRSGFMSSVLRRNKKNDGAGKISRPERKDSAARRDTNLERSPDQLTALRANGTRANATTPTGAPRLHKRTPSGRSGNWPLDNGDESKQPEETEERAASDRRGSAAAAKESSNLGVLFEEEVTGDEKAGISTSTAAPSATRSQSVLAHARSQPSMSRPSFLMRRTMSAASGPAPERVDDAASDATGSGKRKKKFGTLRRMFKLDE